MKNNNFRPIMLELIKKTNYKSILLLIEEKMKISRTEISRITSLSPATVTNACEVLINQGLVLEISRGFSRGGRKPIFLEINPDAGDIVSVSIRKNQIRVVISNLKCEIISSNTQALDTSLDVVEAVISLISEEIKERESKNIIGIGVALDWAFDYSSKLSKPVHNIDQRFLKKAIFDSFKYPVMIEKYANLCAISESAFYYGNNINDLIYLNLDDEVSAGIIMNGNILKSENGMTSDVSHLYFQYTDQKCLCGKNGCVHGFFSVTSLKQRAIHGVISGQSRVLSELCNDNLNDINEYIILQAALLNDDFSLKLLENYVDNLLLLMDNFVQLFNPKAFVLGGKVSVFKRVMASMITTKIENLDYSNFNCVIIDYSHFNENAAVKGASKISLLHSISKFEGEAKDEQ